MGGKHHKRAQPEHKPPTEGQEIGAQPNTAEQRKQPVKHGHPPQGRQKQQHEMPVAQTFGNTAEDDIGQHQGQGEAQQVDQE